jgi:hypothetical protein
MQGLIYNYGFKAQNKCLDYMASRIIIILGVRRSRSTTLTGGVIMKRQSVLLFIGSWLLTKDAHWDIK